MQQKKTDAANSFFKKYFTALAFVTTTWGRFYEAPFQGCQIVYFQTKNPDLGKFWRGLGMEKVGIHILLPFGIPLHGDVAYFMATW
jgi:hypothetical protein